MEQNLFCQKTLPVPRKKFHSSKKTLTLLSTTQKLFFKLGNNIFISNFMGVVKIVQNFQTS